MKLKHTYMTGSWYNIKKRTKNKSNAIAYNHSDTSYPQKPLPAGSVGGFLVCTLAVALFT